MFHKKLSDIADIQSGLVLSRKEAKSHAEKIYKYERLNLRSVGNGDIVNVKTFNEFYSHGKVDNQFITKENEIVMRLFSPLQPVLITPTFAGYVVPSQFAIVRVRSKEILPEYLCFCLSQNNVLNEMAVMDSGQAARGIKISTLSDIHIPILPIEKQKNIIAIVALRKKINRLHLELLDQYSIQADAAIKRVIEGEGL